MILKQLRISRQLSQEQLAHMSGLNVRTVQRIESGQQASVESLKCLAAVLEVDIATINQESFMIDKNSDNWQALPFWLKCCFSFDGLRVSRPRRSVARRGLIVSHLSGFIFCAFGFVSDALLGGGLTMLGCAYLLQLTAWQADRLGIWYDEIAPDPS